MHTFIRRLMVLFLLCVLFTACSSTATGTSSGGGLPSPVPTRGMPTPTPTLSAAPYPTYTNAGDTCPTSISFLKNCQTPQSMRAAYGITPLIQKGYTGQGQTVVDIVSFGSPTLQRDMDAFDQQFNLPQITVKQISPLNEPESGSESDKASWAGETTLDVQIIHALAPGANIVVLVSPVAETEGTIGLPEFRKLLQYAIDNKLGNIISNSWGASEATLKDAAGQAELKLWDDLLQKATTQDGLTLLASSGDNGATDFTDLAGKHLATTQTSSFLNDSPWVTSVGGTSLLRQAGSFAETAWNSNNGASGGGFSAIYSTPSYQQKLPASVVSILKNRRGVPDVAGNADPGTGLAMYENGSWSTAGGTSAAAPMWGALVAIANQMAGHPLGFINPALYQVGASARYTQDFHDITSGNNSLGEVVGFSAISGWDPVTGLGSPNAANLLPDLIAGAKNSG
ncbi:MAG TPA: S53 family peptidase [Ktedonobacteraceae bacterium]